MRNIILTLSLFAIAIGSLYENNYFVRPNEIIWSDSVQLSWDDFAGFELPGKDYELQVQLTKAQRIGFLAVTYTDILYSENNGLHNVKAVFYQGQSFYKIFSRDIKPTPESLRHELYHFHLTELQARNMRQDLASAGESVHQAFIDSLLDKYGHKIDSAYDAYDKFTAHGNKAANQKMIENAIDSLLLQTGNLKEN